MIWYDNITCIHNIRYTIVQCGMIHHGMVCYIRSSPDVMYHISCFLCYILFVMLYTLCSTYCTVRIICCVGRYYANIVHYSLVYYCMIYSYKPLLWIRYNVWYLIHVSDIVYLMCTLHDMRHTILTWSMIHHDILCYTSS